MNFSPFGVPLSAALPVATQYTAGKLTQSVTTANGQVVGVLQGGENGVHYIRPLDTNSFVTASSATQPQQAQPQQAQTLITLPLTMPGAKPGDPPQTVQIQVLNPIATAATPVSQATQAAQQSPKYHISQIPLQTFGQGTTVLTVAYNSNQEGIQIVEGQNGIPEGMTVVAALQPQDIQLIQTQQQQQSGESDKTSKDVTPVALIKNEAGKDEASGSAAAASITIPTSYLQNSTEYIQRIQQNTTLPLSLGQFLKFNNADVVKREQITEDGVIETIVETGEVEQESLIMNEMEGEIEHEENIDDPEKTKKKKKYKKKPPKPKKPKPGQVHIATALDGTTLFCCPECHMAYPEKELLEQHLVGHKIERRFICDICGAGLKRKEHLERHKLGHNPERPFVCTVCAKGFKRKEHLNLHFVIHSGEKTEVCQECGKSFYRKDHLRKHARSHITRRAKEQQKQAQTLITKDGPVTIEVNVPSSQIQIPVHIQVPQHHIQVSENSESEGAPVSTVVLPTVSESISILPD